MLGYLHFGSAWTFAGDTNNIFMAPAWVESRSIRISTALGSLVPFVLEGVRHDSIEAYQGFGRPYLKVFHMHGLKLRRRICCSSIQWAYWIEDR